MGIKNIADEIIVDEICDNCGETKLCVRIESDGHYFDIAICKDCAEYIVRILEDRENGA